MDKKPHVTTAEMMDSSKTATIAGNLQILTSKENLMKSNKYEADKANDPLKKEVKLSDKEIMQICKNLAKRYRNSEQYDDLVSEGLSKIR